MQAARSTENSLMATFWAFAMLLSFSSATSHDSESTLRLTLIAAR
jgi:hypothetical protein